MTIPDKIEKQITLRAPLARVWSAITDSTQFGTWFGCALDGPFEAGSEVTGTIQPTKVDPEVAKLQAPLTGKPFHLSVERIEPMAVFSFRWRPNSDEPNTDEPQPTTLVLFELQELAADRTLLKITESGFDRIPLARRERAFTSNDAGWTHQTKLLEQFLYGQAAQR